MDASDTISWTQPEHKTKQNETNKQTYPPTHSSTHSPTHPTSHPHIHLSNQPTKQMKNKANTIWELVLIPLFIQTTYVVFPAAQAASSS